MKTIGVIGGMGPEASNRLCQLITEGTPAACDQAHVPVITFNNSAIPDRVAAIFSQGTSPLPELIRTARVLEAAGADFLLMPCNTAHYYLEDLQAAVSVPIVNMIAVTIAVVAGSYGEKCRVGLLGSTPTVQCGLYENELKNHGYELVVPSAADQEELVMAAIFGDQGIKAGMHEKPKKLLIEAARRLIDAGADVIVAGCTEISLVLNNGDVSVPVIDPLQVVASYAIQLAMLPLTGSNKGADEQSEALVSILGG
jgi:aspartate racemase